MKALKDWVLSNKGLFIGMCAGLAIAILILTIGFPATLLIAACVCVGAYVGTHPGIIGAIGNSIKSLFIKK
jgi:uncharacterized membrane protein